MTTADNQAYFCTITINRKGSDDYRAFLHWADRGTMLLYEIRGYGATAGQAADSAYNYYVTARDQHSDCVGEWK